MTDLATELERLSAAATPGPWEVDNTDNGESGSERFNYYSVGAGPSGKWQTVFDTLNSDVACVHEEYDGDEYGVTHHAWDEQGRVNCELIVALRNNLPAIIAALRAQQHAEALAAALEEVAGELEAEVEAKRGSVLPRTTERDLLSVRSARAALAAYRSVK